MTAVPGPLWSPLRLRSSSAMRIRRSAEELAVSGIASSVVQTRYGAADGREAPGAPIPTIIIMDCPAFHIHDLLPATITTALERSALPPRSGTVRLVTGADSDIHRRDIDRRGRKEATMVDPARRARLLRD